MNEYTFTWLIDRFSPTHLPNVPKQIRSPVFKAENLKKTSWYLIITLESSGNHFACSLVRNESETEEIDSIKINFNMEIAVDDKKVDVNGSTVSESFKKGDSTIWGSFKFGTSAGKMLIRCNMFDCLLNKNSVSVGVTIHSKTGHLSWSPGSIIDKTSFCGTEATEFEVSLKNVNDKVYLKISRTDTVNTFSYYFMCTIFVHGKKFLIYTREIDNMRDPLNYNQTFELKLGLNKNQITRSGIYFIDIYFNCSALVGTTRFMSQEKSDCMCRINRPTETYSMIGSEAIDTLRNDFELLYTKKIQTDVELKTETEVFHVHKSILSARSPVFRTMFDQDMVENQTGVVDIPDIDGQILDLFLKYMYTGSCRQLNCELALNLMMVAEKYQVYSLKNECSAYLMPILSEDNVCDILCHADMVSDSNLKGCAMDYVKSHADKILLSKSWKTLVKNNANLAAETLCKLSADYGTKAIKEKGLMISTLPPPVPVASINPHLPAAFKFVNVGTNVRNLHQQQTVNKTLTQRTVSQKAVHIQGQEPLAASILAEIDPQERKQMLGEHLFGVIQGWYPDISGKITGMLLEMDNSHLLYLLEHPKSLREKAEEAVSILKAHGKQV